MLSKNLKMTFIMHAMVSGSNPAFRTKNVKWAHFPCTHQPLLMNDWWLLVSKPVAAVGFEPTPPKRLVPKTSALDRSATLPM